MADGLALLVYQRTVAFPRGEQFGLTSQMRRAAVSIAANIVEGCGRESHSDDTRFLDIAFASSRELKYHISLARRLDYLAPNEADALAVVFVETGKVLNGLIRSLRKQ